jgi:hypothetical protein
MYRPLTCTTENRNVPSGPVAASAEQATAGKTAVDEPRSARLSW